MTGETENGSYSGDGSWEKPAGHSYLSFPIDGPGAKLRDRFGDTDLVPFGGRLIPTEGVRAEQVIARHVSPFPIYPPEFSWSEDLSGMDPAIVETAIQGGGRVLHLLGDIDRRNAVQRLPDHGDLLAALVDHCLERRALRVTGPGYLACALYRRRNGLVLHLVNLTGANQHPGYREDVPSVGPLRIEIDLMLAGLELRFEDAPAVECAVGTGRAAARMEGGVLVFEIELLKTHELFVIGGPS
jgi:hypothetical protein